MLPLALSLPSVECFSRPLLLQFRSPWCAMPLADAVYVDRQRLARDVWTGPRVSSGYGQ